MKKHEHNRVSVDRTLLIRLWSLDWKRCALPVPQQLRSRVGVLQDGPLNQTERIGSCLYMGISHRMSSNTGVTSQQYIRWRVGTLLVD